MDRPVPDDGGSLPVIANKIGGNVPAISKQVSRNARESGVFELLVDDDSADHGRKGFQQR